MAGERSEPDPRDSDDAAQGFVTGRRQLRMGALDGGMLAAAAGSIAPARAEGAQEKPMARNSTGAAREFTPPLEDSTGLTIAHANSDVVVDVIKTLKIGYIAANPGLLFAGCTNRSSIMAATLRQNCSPACMKRHRSRWRRAMRV